MDYQFTMDNFEKEVLQSELPVVVDFYADWCSPCKMMAPIVESMAKELEGKCKVGKCNIDENMAIAQKYKVLKIPNFVIFKDGQPITNFMGVMTPEEFASEVKQALL